MAPHEGAPTQLSTLHDVLYFFFPFLVFQNSFLFFLLFFLRTFLTWLPQATTVPIAEWTHPTRCSGMIRPRKGSHRYASNRIWWAWEKTRSIRWTHSLCRQPLPRPATHLSFTLLRCAGIRVHSWLRIGSVHIISLPLSTVGRIMDNFNECST